MTLTRGCAVLGAALAAIFVSVTCVHPPNYIKPCRRSDPNIKQCALERASEALPFILKGDKNFGLPNLTPLNLPEVQITPGNNLNLKLTDVELHGLDKMRIKDVNFDFENKHITVVVEGDETIVVSQYDINGRILILPITGQGRANITFIDGIYKYEFDYELKPRQGKDYAVVINPQLSYELKRAYFHLDNLFNGDKTLSDEMNKFLNDNWVDVNKDLGPAVGETISTIVTAIIKGYFTRIPFDELFLP